MTLTNVRSWKQAVRSGVALALGVPVAALVSGCALGTVGLSGGGSTATGTSHVSFAGAVHGGQQPVKGATVQLYTAGMPAMPSSGGSTGGYGSGATALIPAGSMTPSSTNNYFPGGAPNCGINGDGSNPNLCTALPQTDADGNFSITGEYSCTSGAETYLVATGGDPGVGTTNSYVALMAGLGACGTTGTLDPSLHVIMNEVTTVATVWSLQQFMGAPTGTAASGYASQGGVTSGIGVNIGAPSGPAGGYGATGVQTAVAGLQNAFGMINNLTNITTGSSGTGSQGTALNSWATPWAAKINTIADILAYCINSDPGSSSACTDLMTNATPTSSTAAKDTIQAAWYMAQNPTNNVGTLYGYVQGTPPFAALGTQPNDWGIFVGLAPTFTAGGSAAVASAFNGAFDEYGHLWLTNYNSASPFVSELAGDGSAMAGPFSSYTVNGGYASGCDTNASHSLVGGSTGPKAIAVDLTNIVYVPNPDDPICTPSTGSRSIMRINGSTGYSTTSGGYVAPSVANGWFDNGSMYNTVAVDTNNNVYVANSGSSGKLQQFAPDGTYTAGASLGASSPASIVIDNNTNGSGPYVWLLGSKDCSSPLGQVFQQPLSSFTTTTGLETYQNSTCTGGTHGTTNVVSINATLSTPYSSAVDRNNDIWVANSAAASVAWLVPNGSGVLDTTSATSVSSGLGGVSNPYAVAVDGNNYAWLSPGNSSQPYYVAVLQGTNTGTPAISLAPPLLGSGNAGVGFTTTSSSNPFMHSPRGMAIDPSGNVWFFNNSTSSLYNWVSVLVGQAAPVITPVALQLKAGMIGQKP